MQFWLVLLLWLPTGGLLCLHHLLLEFWPGWLHLAHHQDFLWLDITIYCVLDYLHIYASAHSCGPTWVQAHICLSYIAWRRLRDQSFSSSLRLQLIMKYLFTQIWREVTYQKCTVTMHSVFSSTSKGPYVALAATSPWWPDGDQLTGSQFLHWSKVAHPRDDAAEKEFFWLALQRLWVKKHDFCHSDLVMHRIHKKERRRRTNKFFSWFN